MKKRLLYVVSSAVMMASAFFVGQNLPVQNVKADEVFSDGITADVPDGYINVEDIVDWNTNGEELSILLKDNTEWYAYRSCDAYGNKRAFVPIR